MFVVICSAFGLAIAAPTLHRLLRSRLTGWLLALAPLAMAAYLAQHLPAVMAGQTLHEEFQWVPSLGANLSFQLDGLGLFFSLLITIIGALILIYADGYSAGHPQLGRLYAYLLLFMGAMLGVVLADNIIALFIFWELTSFASYLLIGFYEGPSSRAAALEALLVTGTGGLALLAGLLLIAQVAGSWELSTLHTQHHAIVNHALYIPILALVLLGACTKSAQFPFHFWLPSAMAAPAPVSAYLHSATMVKAGIYLLARLSLALGATFAWQISITSIGTVTMLVGSYLAWHQSDLKRLLAYSTISGLGILVMLVGLGTSLAVGAALTFLLVHSFYKASLFMVAGNIDHQTGARDIGGLGGLARAMPLTTFSALLAGASMASLPPFFGFVGKELLFETTLSIESYNIWLTATAVIANALLFAVVGLVVLKPLFGPLRDTPKPPREARPSMILGPLLLSLAGLAAGILPGTVGQYLIDPATTAVLGTNYVSHLKLWHGFNLMLALSGITILTGCALYLGRNHLLRILIPLSPVLRWGPQRWYNVAMNTLLHIATAQTALLQNGKLPVYVLIVLLTFASLVAVSLYRHLDWHRFDQPLDFQAQELTLGILILSAAALACLTRSRLTAIMSLGVVGYGVALLYANFGAPDLAMTQFAIETLTVILFVLVLYRLPRFTNFSSRATRLRDFLVASAGGAVMTLFVLSVNAHPVSSRLKPFFTEHSLSEAHGRNIVNVILVDFRGLDTMGEILVLSLAGIGVYALVKLRPTAKGA